MGRPGSNLTVRVLTAAIGIPLLLAANYVGGALFALCAAVVAAVGAAELYRMVQKVNIRPMTALGSAFAAALAGTPFLAGSPQTTWTGIVVLLLMTAAVFYLFPGTWGSGLLGWTVTVVAAIYAGLLLGHLTLLRDLRQGAWWVLICLLITWAYDTGAYFAGSTFGSRPFMAHISPKKTVEGVIGGLLLSTSISLVAAPSVNLPIPAALGLGFVGGCAGQAGDLLESMLKRQTGVKDSGNIVPGHGGLLDRVDSLLFTAPLTAYVALLLGHAS